MPKRPTKEFWNKTYPKMLKEYHNPKKARLVTANIWYHELKPKTKMKFNKIRIKRERRK
jgi:hypothetical protein